MTASIPSGHTSVMAQRREPPDALDFFPTPPWATRALFANVLPTLGVSCIDSAWEPACGEGHMAAVLSENFRHVVASDVYDYGVGARVLDYFDPFGITERPSADWIITNPPFRLSLEFAERALEEANVGVALLVRTVWVESSERYFRLFRDRPPTLFAPFVERVPMTKGRWDPEATTATSYAWFIWILGATPRAPFWIPPGCRTGLTWPADLKRWRNRSALQAAE